MLIFEIITFFFHGRTRRVTRIKSGGRRLFMLDLSILFQNFQNTCVPCFKKLETEIQIITFFFFFCFRQILPLLAFCSLSFLSFFVFFVFFFFFVFFRGTPMAYIPGSNRSCSRWPTPQPQQHWSLNPLGKAGDQTYVLVDTGQIRFH